MSAKPFLQMFRRRKPMRYYQKFFGDWKIILILIQIKELPKPSLRQTGAAIMLMKHIAKSPAAAYFSRYKNHRKISAILFSSSPSAKIPLLTI